MLIWADVSAWWPRRHSTTRMCKAMRESVWTALRTTTSSYFIRMRRHRRLAAWTMSSYAIPHTPYNVHIININKMKEAKNARETSEETHWRLQFWRCYDAASFSHLRVYHSIIIIITRPSDWPSNINHKFVPQSQNAVARSHTQQRLLCVCVHALMIFIYDWRMTINFLLIAPLRLDNDGCQSVIAACQQLIWYLYILLVIILIFIYAAALCKVLFFCLSPYFFFLFFNCKVRLMAEANQHTHN